jgi:hypothetical protein
MRGSRRHEFAAQSANGGIALPPACGFRSSLGTIDDRILVHSQDAQDDANGMPSGGHAGASEPELLRRQDFGAVSCRSTGGAHAA